MSESGESGQDPTYEADEKEKNDESALADDGTQIPVAVDSQPNSVSRSCASEAYRSPGKARKGVSE